jgi:uncharacterized protein (UPF0276 family)
VVAAAEVAGAEVAGAVEADLTSASITGTPSRLGVGIGWRPEIDLTVERLPGIDFVEVVAESICPDHRPASVQVLADRGLPIIPHGVSLSLGSAEPPDRARLDRLAQCAQAVRAPLVSEHVAFVRAGGHDAGHLLPLPRTRDTLAVLVANVREAQAALPVPLALENVAALLGWPDDELTDGQFLAELVEQTGVGLLLDVANLHTNHINLGLDPYAALDVLPLEAIAYVHVAGGVLRDGRWHDTHAHPVPAAVLDLLAALCERVAVPGVMLERDDFYPTDAELAGEITAIRDVFDSNEPARHGAPQPRMPMAAAVTELAPPLAAVRAALARQQTELVACLVAGGQLPTGFEPVPVATQADALLAKRRRLVARVRPDLAEADGFRERFDAYARTTPRPDGSVRADAYAFEQEEPAQSVR